MNKRVLVVVDMQNDFVNGSLKNKDAEEIIPFIKNEIVSGDYDKVFFTKDTHSDNYLNTQEGQLLPIEHCKLHTHGWEIVDELKEYAKVDTTITKRNFGYKSLDFFIPIDVEEIVFVGTCTDICVISNVMIAKAEFPEAKITVLSKGCAGLTPEKHKMALEVMRGCQVNVVD